MGSNDKMKVLIACEFSGIVREAFKAREHDAWSCDLESTEIKGQHIQKNVLAVLDRNWDLMIAHPPCTYLAISGARWFNDRKTEQKQAIEFFLSLIDTHIMKICVENPIGIMSTKYQKPDQIIQPWQFGHGETKATCLWLKNLPVLTPTNIVAGRESRIHKMSPSKNRSKLRSLTFQGIADAMADQWG